MSIRPKGKNNIFQGDTLPYPLYPGVHPPPPPKPLSCNAGSNAGSNAVFANRISSKMDLHHNATPT